MVILAMQLSRYWEETTETQPQLELLIYIAADIPQDSRQKKRGWSFCQWPTPFSI